jgi:hypothetical protein
MTTNYARLLKRFDPVGINRYGITAQDLEMVEKYLAILQGDLPSNVWDEAVHFGDEYGASIIIHEVVQIRGLVRQGIRPLRYGRRALSQILAQHLEVHVAALYEEHLYLQDVLLRKYGQRFEVATLLKANRDDETDLDYLLESAIGVFLLETEREAEARRWLERLKGR